jgi:TolB-like protein/Tfp pilus assembly protein PilF
MSEPSGKPSGSGAHAGSEENPSLLRFGMFEVDLRTCELRKRGVRVRLQRQPFKVLVRLASGGGDLVTRDELQSELWGGDTFVDFDQGLNFCVKQIRTALGDDAQNPRYVETLPRQGYRFVAPVSRGAAVVRLVQSGASEETPRSGPSERSVAVLPFSDLSPERDQDYFCEGIAEEILTALRRVERLKVASRACSFRFHSAEVDVREIGRELGVSTLLDGSVRKAGTRLRITVELVDAGDGFQIWSESYDRELRDIFAIQEEIARTVAQALEITLSAQESGALGKQATQDILAYDCYLRGRQRYYEYDRRSIESARELFSRAIERDPRFARAHAGLADCLSYLFTNAGRETAHLDSARASAEKALALDPDLAEAHASLGTALSLAGHHVEAEAVFEAAIRLAPQLFEAHYFYARDCFIRGKLAAAAAHYEEAMRVWPDDYQAPLLVAQVYEDLGRPGDAAAARRRGVVVAEQRLRASPEDARALYMGANGLVALGERERGLEWVERALTLDPDEPMVLYNVACIQCLAGDDEAALSSLERALQAGMTAREWLEHDSNLDPIRDTPRFRALLERNPAR